MDYGSVAQLVEQWIEAPCVGGSIPSRAINLYFGRVAKRLNAADCKSAPSGSGVRIPLSPLNRIQRTLRNPYENRKLTQCAKHTRKFIFFTRILVRVQLRYEAVKTPSEIRRLTLCRKTQGNRSISPSV